MRKIALFMHTSLDGFVAGPNGEMDWIVVDDELKNICQVEHTRHRSVAGFILKILSAIAAYSFFPKKPSIKKDIEESNPALIALLNQPKLIAA
jgi:hypothetical protein